MSFNRKKHYGMLALENMGKAIEMAAGVEIGVKVSKVERELLLEIARKWAVRAAELRDLNENNIASVAALAKIGQVVIAHPNLKTRWHAQLLASTVLTSYMVQDDDLYLESSETIEAQIFRTSMEVLEEGLKNEEGRE